MELTNTQTVIIDFRHTTTVPLPRYIQYDSNILKFIIKDNGKDADLSNVNKIVVSTKRPDGIITQRLLQADGNIITYNIGNEEQRVVGYAELTLQFFNMEKLLSSRRLKVYFGESLGAEFKDGAGYPILQELFIEVGEAVNQTIDAGNFALEKAEMANEAATNANEATQAANTATENANVATMTTQQATQSAIDAANAANTATQEATDAATRAAQTANSATIKANDATASANEAATNATDAASTANIAATNADEKATLADEKAGLAQAKVDELSNLDQTLTQSIANANTATDAATEAATIAETQAGHAKTQGDYAKAQGDKVQDILDAGGAVVSVNGKTGADIKLTADDVGAETPQKAQEKANVAESNAKDYTDQQIENIPPPDLSGLATKEEVDAHLADYKTHTGYAVATGTANNYVATLTPALSAYDEGVSFRLKINTENTGASTVNVNGLGAKSIKKSNGSDVNAGQLKAGSVYTLVYNGTDFILQGEGGEYGTAQSADVLEGKTIGTDNGVITGTMPNRGTFNLGLGVSVPEGYYSGGTTAAGKRWKSGEVARLNMLAEITISDLGFMPKTVIVASTDNTSSTVMVNVLTIDTSSLMQFSKFEYFPHVKSVGTNSFVIRNGNNSSGVYHYVKWMAFE